MLCAEGGHIRIGTPPSELIRSQAGSVGSGSRSDLPLVLVPMFNSVMGIFPAAAEACGA
jgi:hypothetical protein